MVFPWTTVDNVLNKFNSAVEDLDKLAQNAESKAQYMRTIATVAEQRADVYDGIRARARRIASKITDLVS